MAGAAHLLSQAGREVQAADQLLTAVYPLSRDPRMLLGVMRHGCIATELAAQALVLHSARGTAATPEGERAVETLAGLLGSGLRLPEGEAALRARGEFRALLRKYELAPTAFPRGERLVVASEGFASLDGFDAQGVEEGIRAMKDFVYKAGKHVMVGGAQ
jgi:hypothetical protein